MPRGDGTGPAGLGPMTGRGAGFCAEYDTPRYRDQQTYGYGRSFGFGRGMGFRCGCGFGGGYRRRYYTSRYSGNVQPEYDEIYRNDALKRQKKFIEDELAEINRQLSDLK